MSIEVLAGNIAAHWAQAGVLATSALIATRLLNFNDARAKLAALHLTLAAIVLLPIAQPWRVDVPALETTAAAVVLSDLPLREGESRGSIGAVSSPDPSLAVVLIIAAGIAVRLLWLFYGVVRLARFSSQTPEVLPPTVAEPIEAQLRVSPRYIQQTGSRGPWTFGFLQPTVALPTSFHALVPAFQRAVICHELLHIKRRDIAIAFCEELAVAALWFHPWVWLLRARIRVAREQAVDSRVVALLGNRDEYVRCLVDISGHDLAPHFSQAGAGMLRPHELRARVDAMFEEGYMSRTRVAAAAFAFIAVTIATGLVAAAALPLRAPSAAQGASEAPRRQINMVYPEYPQDALERGIRGTVIVDITVNAAGDVSTGAVASGPQELRASAFKAALGLKFTPGQSTTAMKIAVDYTLTGASWGVKIGNAPPTGGISVPARWAENADVTHAAVADPDSTGAYRVGGNIRPPKKIKDSPPEYPAIAQQARVQGVVILEARIDEQGNVTDARPLRSIPLLDQGAIDAVKQWQYEPALRNGVPVPVLMTVTVNFSLRKLFQFQVVRPDGNSSVVELFGTGLIVTPGGRVQLRASPAQDANEIAVSVFSADGQTHLGDVALPLGGPLVQTPTTPSVGLRLLGIR